MTSIATLTVNPTVDRNAKIGRVVADKKLRCYDERFDAGGGGVNVAKAITELGGEALAIFACGGAVGDQLTRLLKQHSVTTLPVSISGSTRENVIVYEEETERQFRFGFPGPTLSDQEQEDCLQALVSLASKPDFVVLSGSLPPGVDADFYGRVINALSPECKVVVDVSGEALERAVDQSVYLLKPNQHELGELAGCEIESDQDARDAAKKLIDRGKVKAVLVSLGRGGAMLVTASDEFRVVAPTVKIRSRIGAGDTTVAGMVLALQRGKSMEEAARFGVACGSAAVMTEGTKLCRREDAETIFEEMSR